jgi:hypothetical protein
LPLLVLAAAAVLAAGVYGHFLAVHRHLWDDPVHDRNAHYLYALRLATDVRQGHVFALLAHLDQARVWPPLHGVVAAGALLAGGLDYRVAVLPNLAGWVATVLLAFLVGRRCLPRGGTLAGLAAALFAAASPAHRAYATDVMLESLGACLTLLVCYSYLRAAQSPADPAAAGRNLGLALTALLLHKYNYWLLAVLALTAATVRMPRSLPPLASFRTFASWLKGQFRRPSTLLLLALLAAVAWVTLRGPRPVEVTGLRVSLYPPNMLLTVAYAVFFVRLLRWWRTSGRERVARLDPRLRGVLRWHAWPLAVWLLLPGHFAGWLWYLSPANAHPDQHAGLWDGLRDYSRWLVDDYHAGMSSAVVAASLCLVGLLSWRRWAPGGRAVLLLVVLAAALSVTHPNRKGRNLHSWLPAAWVVAGVGLASVARGRRAAWLGAACLAALTAVQGPALWAAGRSLEGGPHAGHESFLDVTDAYLPELASAGRATVLAAAPVRILTQWALLEGCGRLDRLEEHWYGFGDGEPANCDGFARWLRDTPCDTIVFVGPLPGQRRWDPGPECDRVGRLLDVLRRQDTFRPVKRRDFPPLGVCVVVWRRD